MFVRVATATTTGAAAPLTGLTFATAAPPMIRTLRVLKSAEVLLGWRVLTGAGIHRSALRLTLDVSDARLFGPSGGLIRVGVDVGDDGSGRFGLCGGGDVGIFGARRRRGVGGLGRVCDLGTVSGGATDVAVSFEDFFGGDVGGVVEEGGVVEDGLEVLGYLLIVELAQHVFEARMRCERTSHISSLYSISEWTTSMARKLSSS